MPKINDADKFEIVISRNTFFFHNGKFEEMYEGYISSLIQTLLVLKQKIEENGLKKEVFIDFIMEKEEGLKALLALLGFSKESLLRLITFIRVYDDSELNNLVKKEFWPQEDFANEWNEDKIVNLVRGNRNIAEGLINLFFEGSTTSAIRKNLPLFEFKKLDINKLNFSTESLIDTIIRYKTKGAYKASAGNNPEELIISILKESKIKYERGKLKNVSRDMDFVIPDKKNPKIIIESSYVVTTSSGMGDKAKTEISVANQIKKHYSKAIFIGFVDGVGWYVRRGDLQRIVSAFSNVFTFEESELIRFEKFLKENISKNCYL